MIFILMIIMIVATTLVLVIQLRLLNVIMTLLTIDVLMTAPTVRRVATSLVVEGLRRVAEDETADTGQGVLDWFASLPR